MSINQEKQGLAVESQLQIPDSPDGIFKLPCGIYDPKTDKVHNEVKVRSMTGEEEDLLSSRKIAPLVKMDQVLAACTESIGTITDRRQIKTLVRDLTVGDRVFLMFAIRRVSLGDRYPFREECPSCGTEHLYNVSLADLEVKFVEDPKKQTFAVTTPTGRKVSFRMMTGHDEHRLDKIKSKGNSLSISMLSRIETIDGEVANLTHIKKLALRDRHFLRDQFEEVEGGVDTTLECSCPFCGHDFERDLDIGQTGFFFPSAVQKAWNKRSST